MRTYTSDAAATSNDEEYAVRMRRRILGKGRYDPYRMIEVGNRVISLLVNGRSAQVDAAPDTPLLWVLRDDLGLTGTKYGCGVGLCGACTVHLDGEAVRSCLLALGEAEGKPVTTIEGLSADLSHPVQRAWIDLQVPQCGYCQPGMIMAVAALLSRTPRPTDADIDAAITNLCRCGTYLRVRRAIHQAAQKSAS